MNNYQKNITKILSISVYLLLLSLAISFANVTVYADTEDEISIDYDNDEEQTGEDGEILPINPKLSVDNITALLDNNSYSTKVCALKLTGVNEYTYIDTETSSDNIYCQYNYEDNTSTEAAFTIYCYEAGDYTVTFTIEDKVLTLRVHALMLDWKEEESIIAKDATRKLSITGASEEDILNWTSSNTSIATIDKTGTVTGKKAGMTTITVTGSSTVNTSTFTATMDVIITNPTLSTETFGINLYKQTKSSDGYYYMYNNNLKIKGINQNSICTIKTSSINIACNAYYNYSDKTIILGIYPKKTGNYKINFNVDGKTLELSVYVCNMYFQRNSKTIDGKQKTWNPDTSMIALYGAETTTLKIEGTLPGKNITYKSSKPSVATVSKTGKITAKSLGSTTITATINSCTISYKVSVSYKNAILAIRYSEKNFGAKYSQSKRMKTGYFDCSSYAWRSYKSTKVYMGSNKNYAPTAADMAKWCTNNNYIVYSGNVSTSKLLPGDLVFLCGKSNGRYKGIYHVDVYVGNNTMLSVQTRKYTGSILNNVIVARPCGTVIYKPMATSTTKKKITIKWTGTYGASGYQIYRSTSKNGKYVKVGIIGSTKVYADGKVKSGKGYYYKVRAYWKYNGKVYYGKFCGSVGKKCR